MKMSRKILVITICVLLLLSISLVSFALPVKLPQPLLRGDKGGYHYVGYGSTTVQSASASLMLSPIEGAVHIPPEDCHIAVTAKGLDSRGLPIGSATDFGSTYASITYTRKQDDPEIYSAECTYVFMSTELGKYTVYPS